MSAATALATAIELKRQENPSLSVGEAYTLIKAEKPELVERFHASIGLNLGSKKAEPSDSNS